jgi:hypothetical protein
MPHSDQQSTYDTLIYNKPPLSNHSFSNQSFSNQTSLIHTPPNFKTVKIPPTKYKVYRSWICCSKYKDRSSFQNILEGLDLNETQKQIIQVRYLNILENFQRRCRNYSYLFFSGHIIITVGSLFVPALLSIQNSDKTVTLSNANFSVQIYWATFVISILVTIFNGIITLFKVDKKYYFLNTTLERLRSEGWQYFSLTGRYSGHLITHTKPTHKNQYVFFTHYIEKIKMKQVEEEYYKADEKSAQAPNGNHTSVQSSSDLYPPSPDQPLNTMVANMPEPVKDALNSLIQSQTIEDSHSKDKNTIVSNTEHEDKTPTKPSLSIIPSIASSLTPSSSPSLSSTTLLTEKVTTTALPPDIIIEEATQETPTQETPTQETPTQETPTL